MQMEVSAIWFFSHLDVYLLLSSVNIDALGQSSTVSTYVNGISKSKSKWEDSVMEKKTAERVYFIDFFCIVIGFAWFSIEIASV